MINLHEAMPYSTPLQAALFILQTMVINIPNPGLDLRARVIPIKNALNSIVREEAGLVNRHGPYRLYNLSLATEQLTDFKENLPTELPLMEEKIDKIIHKIEVLRAAVQMVSARRALALSITDDQEDSEIDRMVYDEFDSESDTEVEDDDLDEAV
jgi:hypothetical protein